MRTRRCHLPLLGVSLLLAGSGCASGRAEAGGARTAAIVGAWRVRSIEQVRADGTRSSDWMGPRPVGLVVFDASGAFSLQYGRDPPVEWPPEKAVLGAPPEEKAAIFRAHYSYFGRFEFDEGRATIDLVVERSLWPTEDGKKMRRFVRLQGDRLTLTTPPYPNGSTFVIALERAVR